jgi:hypothetical protein
MVAPCLTGGLDTLVLSTIPEGRRIGQTIDADPARVGAMREFRLSTALNTLGCPACAGSVPFTLLDGQPLRELSVLQRCILSDLRPWAMWIRICYLQRPARRWPPLWSIASETTHKSSGSSSVSARRSHGVSSPSRNHKRARMRGTFRPRRLASMAVTASMARNTSLDFPSGRPHLGRRGALGRRGMRREGESAGRWLGDG